MTTRSVLVSGAFSAVLVFSSVTLAQAPVQSINANTHPNLAAAQGFIIQAYEKVQAARKDNDFDMTGHAAKAQSLLTEASRELKLAADYANKNRH